MKHSTLIYAVAAALTVFSPALSLASGRAWEQVKYEVKDARRIAREADIEIRTAPTSIIVTSSKNVQIKVFTILGRLVSEESLPPGTSRLDVGAHGVYIVKVGDFTCKVAI